MFEKDLGSALVFFFVFLVMLYVATERSSTWSSVWVSSPSAVSSAFMAFGHVQVRVNTWLDPFADAQNTGYQLTQAIFLPSPTATCSASVSARPGRTDPRR